MKGVGELSLGGHALALVAPPEGGDEGEKGGG